MYQHNKVPTTGQKITVNKDFTLNVPDQPIIPFIEGDGTGADIWRASVRVLDAADKMVGFVGFDAVRNERPWTDDDIYVLEALGARLDLSPAQIAGNHAFADLAEIWLGGDHYKWRAMRSNGVPERLCTGDASPREKFDAWCATVPYALRNPLYHWSHLELKRYFNLDAAISPAPASSTRLGHFIARRSSQS